MASLTDCKGMCVPDTTPTGDAGEALLDNFVTLTNRIGPCHYTATTNPTGSDDDQGNSTTGITFSIGSQWLNTTSKIMWVYAGGASPNAKWLPTEEYLSSVSISANTLARRSSQCNLCAKNFEGNYALVCGVCASGWLDSPNTGGKCVSAWCRISGPRVCACIFCGASYVYGNYVCAGCRVYGYKVCSTCLCAYKIYTSSAIDPPSVLYDPQTRQAIARMAKETITPDHADGALLFYNRVTGQLEVYKMSEGVFSSVTGEVLETLPQPEMPNDEDVETYFRFDRQQGRIVEGQRLKHRLPGLKTGYGVDAKAGHFVRKSDGERVEQEEAVE